nr:RHS repeat-associated core domain-containing protein [Streptomyces sp. MK7]
MGVRLYDPTTGRFLSIDPVPGGSADAYEYCNGDPISHYDLDGCFGAGCGDSSTGTGPRRRERRSGSAAGSPFRQRPEWHWPAAFMPVDSSPVRWPVLPGAGDTVHATCSTAA